MKTRKKKKLRTKRERGNRVLDIYIMRYICKRKSQHTSMTEVMFLYHVQLFNSVSIPIFFLYIFYSLFMLMEISSFSYYMFVSMCVYCLKPVCVFTHHITTIKIFVLRMEKQIQKPIQMK